MGYIPVSQCLNWETSLLPLPLQGGDNLAMRIAKLSADAIPLAREIHRRAIIKKIGQKKLAVDAGLNETFVRDLYDGSSKAPSAENIDKIASVLGCTIDELLHPERAVDPKQRERYAQTDEELAILLAWRDGGDALKEAMVTVVQEAALGPLTRLLKR